MNEVFAVVLFLAIVYGVEALLAWWDARSVRARRGSGGAGCTPRPLTAWELIGLGMRAGAARWDDRTEKHITRGNRP